MNGNAEKEMDELMQGIADELDYANEDESLERSKRYAEPKSQTRVFLLWGGVIVLLIVLVAVLLGGSDEVAPDSESSIIARLDQIESRLQALDGINARIEKLEERERDLTQSIAKANTSSTVLAGRFDELNQEVSSLQKGSSSVAVKTGEPPDVRTDADSASEGRYHVVRAGDSLYRIARRYGISVDDLRRLNNISPKQAIYPGEKILVAKGSP